MIRKVQVVHDVEVNPDDETLCLEDCEFNQGTFCSLFDEELESFDPGEDESLAIRLEECKELEVKNETNS